MSTVSPEAPSTDVDLFDHEFLQAPYAAYRELREQGRAVHVPAQGFWLIPRYDDVRAAAADWETFTSSQGVALLDDFNQPMLGTILASDPPRHTDLRGVLSEQLAPRALGAVREHIGAEVARVVSECAEAGSFDGVSQLGQRIPLEVVSHLIGLPEEGRDTLLPGADAVFTTFGPFSPTVESRMGDFMAYMGFMTSFTDASRLRPGSWGADIFAAVEAGRITGQDAVSLMMAYLVAGMDTTSNSLTALLHLFATRPDVWHAVQEDPSRASAVYEECLRLESPVQGFFRVVTKDVDLGDAVVPAGDRVLLHFGMANRDDAHYADADEFQIDRNPIDHMAFGYGTHSCAGQGLARLEAKALAAALVDQVASIELAGDPELHENPVVRGFGHLPLTVVRK
jgi:cytochrome P450